MGCHYRQNSVIVTFVNGASNFVYGVFVFINGASVFVNGASNFVYGAFVFINGASVFVNGASNFVRVLFMVPSFSHMLSLNLLMVPLILLNWCLYLCIWCLCVLKNAAAFFVNGASNIQRSGNDSLVT